MKSESQIVLIPLGELYESPTNPRAHYDPAALEDLAQSIRTSGIAQPITVRARKAGGFEIVLGHRRTRAARLATLAEVPAIIRDDLDDAAVIQLQLIENVQREDLSPIEQAAGYRKLLDESGMTVDQLGAEIGKSRTQIYASLRLLDLPDVARKAVESRALSSEVGILLARLRSAKVVRELLPRLAADDRQDGASFREARDLIRNYVRDLARAPFSLEDATLQPKMGACTGCPHRSGNAPDFDQADNPSLCMLMECYDRKVDVHRQRLAADMERAGARVGKELDRYSVQWELQRGGLIDLTKPLPAIDPDVPLEQVLAGDLKGAVAHPVGPDDLLVTMTPAALNAALERVGLETRVKEKKKAAPGSDRGRMSHMTRLRDAREKFRRAALTAVRDRIEKSRDPLTGGDLVDLVGFVLESAAFSTASTVRKLWPGIDPMAKDRTKLHARLQDLKPAALGALGLCAVVDAAIDDTDVRTPPHKSPVLARILARHGVDPLALWADVDPDKKPAAPAQNGPAGGKATANKPAAPAKSAAAAAGKKTARPPAAAKATK